MKLALHRSITFWSGILVMAFFVWGWRTSYDYRSYINYERFVIIQAEGYLSIGRIAIPSINDAGHNRVPHGQYHYEFAPVPRMLRGQGQPPSPAATQTVRYSDAMEWAYTSAPPSAWALFIPHWLWLLAVALTWATLLFCRARRRRRAAILQQLAAEVAGGVRRST